MASLARWMLMVTLVAPMAAAAQEAVSPALTGLTSSRFDDPYLVYNATRATQGAPLVVFLPGTGGRASGAPQPLLQTVASLGYRVIFLSYDDSPSVSKVCPDQGPDCSEQFRRARLFGDGGGPVSNPRAEAIVPRLSALLTYLNTAHPRDGWGAYLAAGGTPAWPMIVMSGFSQGGGMAAYLAKTVALRRVVLFSNPWDFTGAERQPAPWLSHPSATPPERWWAERHAREHTTAELAAAYRVLGIPADHIMVFNTTDAGDGREGRYHGSTIHLTQYEPQWRVLFGKPGPVGR